MKPSTNPRRPAAVEDTLERICTWRKTCPALVIRSTFIVGFPGETDDDFEQLLDWLAEVQLDRVGCFRYSPVDGAAANALPDPVPEEIKDERWHRLMQHQQRISETRLSRRIGNVEPVLVDSVEGSAAIARSYGDAPEIDGNIIVEDTNGLQPRAFIDVEITGHDSYDLFARRVNLS